MDATYFTRSLPPIAKSVLCRPRASPNVIIPNCNPKPQVPSPVAHPRRAREREIEGLQDLTRPQVCIHGGAVVSASRSQSMCMSWSVMIDNQLKCWVDHSSFTRLVIHSPLVGYLVCVCCSSKKREKGYKISLVHKFPFTEAQ